MQPDRFTQIRHYLYRNGLTGVNDLASFLDTSVVTIRRDLHRLESMGLIRRTRGGAELVKTGQAEVGFDARTGDRLSAKRAIGEAAYARLAANASIFLDAGTTVLQLALRIKLEPLPLNVFTNSVAIVQTLLDVPKVQITLIAGRIRNENRSIVGPLAERTLGDLYFDQLFLGASAVQHDGTVATHDGDEASLNAVMIARSEESLLLVDSRKFGQHATYRVANLTELSEIITDTDIKQDWTARLAQQNIALSRIAFEPED